MGIQQTIALGDEHDAFEGRLGCNVQIYSTLIWVDKYKILCKGKIASSP